MTVPAVYLFQKNKELIMNNFKFSEENLQKIDNILKKYPVKKPAVMPVLYLAQEQNGFISNEVIREVASILEMTPEEVLGVVTFYTMYHQKPMGKYHIQVCTNVSCMLRGGYDLYDKVKEKLVLIICRSLRIRPFHWRKLSVWVPAEQPL